MRRCMWGLSVPGVAQTEQCLRAEWAFTTKTQRGESSRISAPPLRSLRLCGEASFRKFQSAARRDHELDLPTPIDWFASILAAACSACLANRLSLSRLSPLRMAERVSQAILPLVLLPLWPAGRPHTLPGSPAGTC